MIEIVCIAKLSLMHCFVATGTVLQLDTHQRVQSAVHARACMPFEQEHYVHHLARCGLTAAAAASVVAAAAAAAAQQLLPVHREGGGRRRKFWRALT